MKKRVVRRAVESHVVRWAGHDGIWRHVFAPFDVACDLYAALSHSEDVYQVRMKERASDIREAKSEEGGE